MTETFAYDEMGNQLTGVDYAEALAPGRPVERGKQLEREWVQGIAIQVDVTASGGVHVLACEQQSGAVPLEVTGAVPQRDECAKGCEDREPDEPTGHAK